MAVTSIYYIQGDHLGTPRVVTNGANQVVWRNQPLSEPFGLSAVEEDPDGDSQSFVLNLRFAGQYYDKETGTHYNVQRDYDPVAGRYLQSDPIGLAGGANTYAYVESNPLLLVDPWGLCAKTIGPNAQSGKLWENQVNTAAESKYGKANVESQVLVRPLDANGNPVNYRVRLDNIITQPGQPIRLLDAKGSAKAGFTKRQRSGYPFINDHGDIIESGAMKGMQIPKTKVQLVRPGGLGQI